MYIVILNNIKFYLQKYFTILGVSSDCDQEQVRQAFLNMVKRFHPDSGSPEANTDRFHLV